MSKIPEYTQNIGAVVLYDAACGLCGWTVRFVLSHERKRTLRFASLSGAFGRRLMSTRPELERVDSVVWVEVDRSGAPTTTLVRSAAVLRIFRYLGGWWAVLQALWIIPRPLRDWVYGLVARHRHRIMGRVPCVVPTPDNLQRFLDTE